MSELAGRAYKILNREGTATKRRSDLGSLRSRRLEKQVPRGQ